MDTEDVLLFSEIL